MLSKSKGQILRVVAFLHALFHLDTPERIPSGISEEAMKVADNFVSICLQHAVYIASRDGIYDLKPPLEALLSFPPERLHQTLQLALDRLGQVGS